MLMRVSFVRNFMCPCQPYQQKHLFKLMYSYFKQRSNITPMTKHNYKVIG
jgi:hypothetical protein